MFCYVPNLRLELTFTVPDVLPASFVHVNTNVVSFRGHGTNDQGEVCEAVEMKKHPHDIVWSGADHVEDSERQVADESYVDFWKHLFVTCNVNE